MVAPSSALRIHLTVPSASLFRFFPVLQSGFMVETETGTSIQAFLGSLPGVDPSYAEDRIKTVFLDGKAVDDMNTAFLKDGSTLALSAAMPGLAGATLRRGGRLASFRSGITFSADQGTGPTHGGWILVKLFNLIIKELGPVFLNTGILLEPADARDFFNAQPEEFWTGLKQVTINGQSDKAEHLHQIDWSVVTEPVALKADFVS
jgi:hypothetical protein